MKEGGFSCPKAVDVDNGASGHSRSFPSRGDPKTVPAHSKQLKCIPIPSALDPKLPGSHAAPHETVSD
jgi:hypothetical protein